MCFPTGFALPSILRRVIHICVLCSTALAACAAAPTAPTPSQSAQQPQVTAAERGAILGAMEQELARSMEQLKFKDYQSPYFIAYQLKDVAQQSVFGRFGSLLARDDTRTRLLYTEVRVGDYSFDNFANIDAESFRMQDFESEHRAPLDADTTALRGALWSLTDDMYKAALSDYLTKKGGAVYATEEKTDVPSFSREPAASFDLVDQRPEFDRKRWEELTKKVTTKLREASWMLNATMEVASTYTTRYFVNSEGTRILDDHLVYSIQIEALARAKDGMALTNGRSFYAREVESLPGEEELMAQVEKMVKELQALRSAPVIDPYTGPAILMPEASGVLFHEAIGHRLEGERQRDDAEGRTFEGRLGKKVIPAFLSVYDDPTLRAAGDTQLNGFYEYDDEGVKGQRAVLIEAGVLRGYLKSRTPVEGAPRSNGHGRAQGIRKPMARMSNLVVQASEAQTRSYEALKAELIAEVKRQGKPFGLIIRDITGGSTNTSGYGYQAFKGASRLIYKVDPATGGETLVRGAELVGTPLVSISKIIAASKETGVFNGYCGAESGYVPVSTVAPALLTTEVELQRTQSSKERPPLLPPPWK